MGVAQVAPTPISAVLDSLDDPDLRVLAWRLYSLERGGFSVTPATIIAKDHRIDTHLAIRMKDQGCPEELVAEILS